MEKKPEHIFDELLVLKCQSGDKLAFELLVKRWHQKLLRQANRHLNDAEISKDVVQDSWQAIVKRIYTLKDPSKFGVWALSITSRKSIDWIRKKQINRKREFDNEAIQIEYSSDTGNEKEEKLNSITMALRNLPPDQRIVLSMFYLEDQSLSDISTILAIPIGTVKSRLYHGREHLKKILIERK